MEGFGKYDGDYKEIWKKMREMKGEVEVQDRVGEFKKGEREVEWIVDEVRVETGHAV